MLTERTSKILEAVIHDFIQSGEPISSGHLYARHRFSVKPATIRNELSSLEENGFLCQLHTSGGRVPTDKGYQFLVDRILRGLIHEEIRAFSRAFVALQDEFIQGEFKEFIDNFSHALRVLGVSYVADNRSIRESHRSGLDELMRTLDFSDRNEIIGVIEDIERMDERVDRLFEWLRDDETLVFVGRSPITRSRQLSVIARKYTDETGDVFLVAVGPKRMNYEQVISCFKSLTDRASERGRRNN